MNMRSLLFLKCTRVVLSCLLFCFSVCVSAANTLTPSEQKALLHKKLAIQHQKIIPVVAVADMFFACNQVNLNKEKNFKIDELIQNMNTDELAMRLSHCLGEHSIKSDVALDYGLRGCFHDQISELPPGEKEQKMQLVINAIASLPQHEKQKSFTQCVNDQAIKYLE